MKFGYTLLSSTDTVRLRRLSVDEHVTRGAIHETLVRPADRCAVSGRGFSRRGPDRDWKHLRNRHGRAGWRLAWCDGFGRGEVDWRRAAYHGHRHGRTIPIPQPRHRDVHGDGGAPRVHEASA